MSVSQAAKQHSWFTQYQTSDVAENLLHSTAQRIVSNSKMETRHPIEKSFGSEFMAICNHCIVMAAWSRKNVACLSKCRYCTDCAQNLPGSTPNNVLRVLQISSISVHFQLSHSRMHEHHQTAP